MLNFFKISSLVVILAILFGCNKSKIIELPLSEKAGFGPFIVSYGGFSTYSEDENNPWAKTYLKVKGIPEDWTEVKLGHFETNIYQTVYQHYYTGDISPEWYERVQDSWGWIPDSLNLSKEPLKTRIAYAYGIDQTGSLRMVVDADNNLDFSDDRIIEPSDMRGVFLKDRDSIALSNSIMVTYELLQNNRIVEAQVPVNVVWMGQNEYLMSNFPQHAVAQIDGIDIAICSDNFTSLSYSKTNILLMDGSIGDEIIANRDNILTNNEYFIVKGKVYRNLGVNRNKNVLQLEKITIPIDQLYSTQPGFRTIPFKGQDFIDQTTTISNESLKGKYVLLDFWAVWCGPCIAEFSLLKEIYENADKSKFEIVGIIGESKPEAIRKIMEEKSVSWPQILSDNENKIKENYGVYGYPTTFLIDPDVIIIAKNLRGDQLKEKIFEILN